MAKKKTGKKPFRLSGKAGARLNTCLAEIRKGIMRVCELHAHDSAPSMSKAEFETTYIDKVLGQPITAISATLRAFMEGLQEQKTKEVETLMRECGAPIKGGEDA